VGVNLDTSRFGEVVLRGIFGSMRVEAEKNTKRTSQFICPSGIIRKLIPVTFSRADHEKKYEIKQKGRRLSIGSSWRYLVNT
jgi:hypothetical protein